jgi:hypothetical protein
LRPFLESKPVGLSANYCYCSVGYAKELHEQIFDGPVDVEMVESNLQGTPRCRFEITVSQSRAVTQTAIQTTSRKRFAPGLFRFSVWGSLNLDHPARHSLSVGHRRRICHRQLTPFYFAENHVE